MNPPVKWHVTRVLNVVHMAPTLLAIERFGRPWGLRKKGRHNGSRCRGSSGFGFGLTPCVFLLFFFEDDQTSEILRMFEFDFDIIFFLHIEASWKFIIKTLILDVLYNMVSQLHLANRWYEVSTTSGTSTALPTAVEFSSGVVFMCCFCFESFMEDSIKRENEG